MAGGTLHHDLHRSPASHVPHGGWVWRWVVAVRPLEQAEHDRQEVGARLGEQVLVARSVAWFLIGVPGENLRLDELSEV
jgi:hypothetical protein